MCVITTKGMISGEVLKHRNGLFARRGQPSRVSRRNLLGPPAMASLSMLGLSVSVRTEGHDSQASSLRPHQRRTSTRDSACGSAACGSCYAIDSRSPSGAQTMVFWSNCSATRLADTAVFRQAIRTRSDSIMPSRLRGVTVASLQRRHRPHSGRRDRRSWRAVGTAISISGHHMGRRGPREFASLRMRPACQCIQTEAYRLDF
jgi:hypothetical protein